jgi:sodium-dependent phosphate transporter
LQATSVASKSVTLPQAVAIASIFEFCGVIFLGASVTSTVRGKIFNTSDYEDMPDKVMLGMFTSLVSASFMMMIATYLGMPVSTTHTVIGCIIGFAVSAFLLHLKYNGTSTVVLTSSSLSLVSLSSVSCQWYTIG